LDIDLHDLVPLIDWTPFFRSWDLHGRYPDLFSDEVVGAQAQTLFEDAQGVLDILLQEKKLSVKGIYGLFEAYSDDQDDIVLPQNGATFRTLRQQAKKKEGVAYMALSDFIAPKETGITDYVGCFCVSAGFGADEWAQEYEAQLDDYNSIMVKAIADRFAEAAAEWLHLKVRTEFWGYASDESLEINQIIGEQYRGIRPAPGYPACPDHLEKQTIWQLLDVEGAIGVRLTESLAMWPAASVSGYYFAHPEARYFGLGKITQEQVADFARRKNIPLAEAQRWLSPNIAD